VGEAVLEFQLNPEKFSDWSGLHQLLGESFAYMDARIDPPSSLKKFDAEGLKQKAQEENLLVVHDGDELVACAFMKLQADKVYIGKVAVSLGQQGKGIGHRVIEMAREFTRQQGKKILELETRIELVENHKAFSAMGFVKTAETSHPGYDHATAITMQCKV
jgi:predicted GNAT family N-acyltransferase